MSSLTILKVVHISDLPPTRWVTLRDEFTSGGVAIHQYHYALAELPGCGPRWVGLKRADHLRPRLLGEIPESERLSGLDLKRYVGRFSEVVTL